VAKFKAGDRVRVVSVTDIDAELDSPERVITDPDRVFEFTGCVGPTIGSIGFVVNPATCDYYDLTVQFDDVDDITSWMEADLVLEPMPELGGAVRITTGTYRGSRGALKALDSMCAVVALDHSDVDVYLLPSEIVATTPYGQGS
jgi:hypothetical protein